MKPKQIRQRKFRNKLRTLLDKFFIMVMGDKKGMLNKNNACGKALTLSLDHCIRAGY